MNLVLLCLIQDDYSHRIIKYLHYTLFKNHEVILCIQIYFSNAVDPFILFWEDFFVLRFAGACGGGGDTYHGEGLVFWYYIYILGGMIENLGNLD